MPDTLIYVSVQDHEGQLIVDGSLSLLERLLAALRPRLGQAERPGDFAPQFTTEA